MSQHPYPWESNFYNAALFEAGAGDKDTIKTLTFYLEQIGTCPRKILDVGCGTGRFSLRCIEAGHWVNGIDSSKDMLNAFTKKVNLLSSEQKARLKLSQGDFLKYTAQEQGEYDFIVALDDFTSHFCTITELEQFFHVARQNMTDNGYILTDLRCRTAERLESAANPGPKAVHTFGIASNVKSEGSEQHVSMRFWEEYDVTDRILLCHQIYDYIENNGHVKRTCYRTIRQRVHTVDDLNRAANQAGLHLENDSIDSNSAKSNGSEHHFFKIGVKI